MRRQRRICVLFLFLFLLRNTVNLYVINQFESGRLLDVDIVDRASLSIIIIEFFWMQVSVRWVNLNG